MGCRPRNAVWSRMQSLRKTQQKTRLSFKAEMPTCAPALVGPSLAHGLPTDLVFGCLDGAAPCKNHPKPHDGEKGRRQQGWVRAGDRWYNGFPSLQPRSRNPI